jgi:hypothetical protein
MEDFHGVVRQVARRTAYVTVFWAVLWLILPPWKAIFAGLTIGSAVSLYFAISIARQTEMATAVALGQKKKKPIVALISRIAMIALGVMAILRLGYPSIWWFLAGLYTYQVVLFAGMILDRGKGK